jgi:hypothetical protein
MSRLSGTRRLPRRRGSARDSDHNDGASPGAPASPSAAGVIVVPPWCDPPHRKHRETRGTATQRPQTASFVSSTPSLPASQHRQGEMLICRSFQALFRTRTGDPLLAMLIEILAVGCPRAITRGTVSPAIAPIQASGMRRETSRVSFLMCPICVRGPLTAVTTAADPASAGQRATPTARASSGVGPPTNGPASREAAAWPERQRAPTRRR